MKPKIKGIIFDLGGVLIGDFSKAFFANTSKELGVPVDKVRRAIRREEVLLQQGKETSAQFWRRICKKLRIKAPPNKVLLSLWSKPYRKNAKLNKGTLLLIKQLSKKYPLGVISNTLKEHTAVNRKRNFFKYFDVVLLSHDVGLRKPQKEIFQLASKRLHIPLSSILFIDDELRWVKAARKAGLQSIQFKSPEQLEKRLKVIKVL